MSDTNNEELIAEACEFIDPEIGFTYKDGHDAAQANDVIRRLVSALVSRPPVPAEMVECPHWNPGQITLRKGCTACAPVTPTDDREALDAAIEPLLRPNLNVPSRVAEIRDRILAAGFRRPVSPVVVTTPEELLARSNFYYGLATEALERLHASSIPLRMSEAQFNAAAIVDVTRILSRPFRPTAVPGEN